MLRFPEALKIVQDEARDVFGATHVDDETLATSKNANTVFLNHAYQHYLTNTDKPKNDFPVYVFCNAAAQYVSVH